MPVVHDVLQRILSRNGEDELSIDDKMRLYGELRASTDRGAEEALRGILTQNDELHKALLKTHKVQGELKEILGALSAPPWHGATYLGALLTPDGPRAKVRHGDSPRVVSLAPELDMESLCVGDDVFLTQQLNSVIARGEPPTHGDVAMFESWTPDGRAILKWRGEDSVATVADSLAGREMGAGDRVRWSASLRIAYEKLELGDDLSAYILTEMPDVTFNAIGGLDSQIRALKDKISAQLEHPKLAQKYNVRRRRSVLLTGPPGTGKTMLAKALANYLREITGQDRVQFVSVKPSALHSSWFADSEGNYRRLFRAARQAAQKQPNIPVVIFFDEIDAIAGVRGRAANAVSDRVLLAFAAELDGMEANQNIFIVAATNRPQDLDPALIRPGRLGDVILEVPRPQRDGARAIFKKYFDDRIPFAAPSGASATAAPDVIIEGALSRIFCRNDEGTLATLKLRDGKARRVSAADLINGAVIRNICEKSSERAFLREAAKGPAGIGLGDVYATIDDEFWAAAKALSPTNCGDHIANLPQDVDVIRVDLARRHGRPTGFWVWSDQE